MKNISPLSHRILAAFIDVFFYLILYQLAILPLAKADSVFGILDGFILFLFMLIVVFPLTIPLYSILITANFGGTLGKIMTGLSVVNNKNRNLSLKEAFFRNYVGFTVSGILLWMGFIWITIDRQRRGWHDMIAGSFVVIKSKQGIITGIFSLFLILFLNFILFLTILQQFKLHEKFYQDTITDIVDSVKFGNAEKI